MIRPSFKSKFTTRLPKKYRPGLMVWIMSMKPEPNKRKHK